MNDAEMLIDYALKEADKWFHIANIIKVLQKENERLKQENSNKLVYDFKKNGNVFKMNVKRAE